MDLWELGKLNHFEHVATIGL